MTVIGLFRNAQETLKIPAGGVIFTEGDEGGEMYGIVEATAVATTDSVLAVIDRRRFLFLVQETPMFALQVMSTMANRFRLQA
jgi:CRP/FNR family cyclic AMP-dependent transcriptional regulator